MIIEFYNYLMTQLKGFIPVGSYTEKVLLLLIVTIAALIWLKLITYCLKKFINERAKEKSMDIEMTLDGDLKMTEPALKDFNIRPCPSCGKRTISWMHAIKKPQTCGNCTRRFVGVIPESKNRFCFCLAMISILVGVFLLSIQSVSSKISFLVAIVGLLIFFLYRLWPKKLVEVKD
ncbi:hypothetical protein BALOs_1163 [Halobacteriovorax sp. BALOs_7]|nr:hypothetical protein BALOs_1163 [Halobacteriovorax sp. BALOs_7]